MATRGVESWSMSVLAVTLLTLKIAPGCAAIECYVCDSSSQIGCAEFLTDTSLLEPESCDNVYDAKYCVKMTQVFEASGTISCYQCDNAKDLYCGQHFNEDTAAALGILPRPCTDVYDAQHCIKTTGMFGGQLGTKRFCSSRDFGNYCEWVNRPGDPNTYQACVLTCSSNSCNSASGSRAASLLVAMATVIGLVGVMRAAR